MMWIAALAASAAANLQEAPRTPARPLVQATATVRILKATRLHFGEEQTSGTPPLKGSEVRLGGVSYPAMLVEFE